jgi:hypothetical protein
MAKRRPIFMAGRELALPAPTMVLNDPGVVKLHATIIRALAPHPEARAPLKECGFAWLD